MRRMVRSQRGVMLLAALFTVALVAAYLGATMTRTLTESQAARHSAQMAQVFHVAEGGLDQGLSDVRNLFFTSGAFPKADEDGRIDQLAGMLPPTFAGYTFVTSDGNPGYTVAYVGAATQRVFTDESFQGMTGTVRPLEVTAEVIRDGSTARARLRQTIELQIVPIFQFAIFFDGVLRLSPGPPMTLNGTIRSNADIVLNHSSLTGPFQIDGIVQAAGNIQHMCPASPGCETGDIQIKDANGVYQSVWLNPTQVLDSTHPDWRNQALTRWGGTVKDQAHGITPVKIERPREATGHIDLIKRGQTTDPQALKDYRLYYKADLRIIDGFAEDRNGVRVSLPPDVVTTTRFYDLREKRLMSVTDIDVAKLRAKKVSPDNGILYIAEPFPGDAIRLINGECLPSKADGYSENGLTVVTENPLYVKGDYNTGSCTGGSKQPAALLSDAFTILSANWKDADNQVPTKLDQRKAASTTINAAVMTGISPVPSDNNPGSKADLVNYMRLLEDWQSSPQTLTYRGSLINFWTSEQAQGPLHGKVTIGGVRYTLRKPPRRNFGFDTDFLNPANLPPGTPRVLSVVQSVWQQD